MHFTLLQASPPTDTMQWLPLAALVIGVLYIFVLRPMGRKKTKDPMEEESALKTLAQQRHVEREMQHLLVELSEMSRKMTAQIDTRATKLELLIEEADAKIEQLRALSAAAGPSARERFRIDRDPDDAAPVLVPADRNRSTDPRHEEIYSLADQGRSPAEIADGLHRPRGEIELILALRGK
jgi:hypothetical protein